MIFDRNNPKVDTLYVIEHIPQAAKQGNSFILQFKELIPLLQTLSWVLFITCCLIFFRREIMALREALSTRLSNGAALKIGLLELGAIQKDVEAVKSHLQATNDRISKVFITTMGINMFTNLQKISSGDFGPFWKTPGLIRELYYLRDIGYIEIASITDIPDSDKQLSHYVKATVLGKEFVKLRLEVTNEASEHQ